MISFPFRYLLLWEYKGIEWNILGTWWNMMGIYLSKSNEVSLRTSKKNQEEIMVSLRVDFDHFAVPMSRLTLWWTNIAMENHQRVFLGGWLYNPKDLWRSPHIATHDSAKSLDPVVLPATFRPRRPAISGIPGPQENWFFGNQNKTWRPLGYMAIPLVSINKIQ